MLGAEVGAEVHDLPGPEADEQPGGADAEPLDAGVCALVGVAELLLALAQVLHLLDNLTRHLLDAAQVGLDGLELLVGLDGGPVAGVGANLDVELNVAGRGGGTVGCFVLLLALSSSLYLFICRDGEAAVRTAGKQVLEANVKRSISVRGEDDTVLADDITRATILVAKSITDLKTTIIPTLATSLLYPHPPFSHSVRRGFLTSTHMNVDDHAVALEAADDGLDGNHGVAGDKVADAALLAVALAARVRGQLELEGAGDADEQQEAAEPLERRSGDDGHCYELCVFCRPVNQFRSVVWFESFSNFCYRLQKKGVLSLRRCG